MDGPIANFTPGYNASIASAIKCADECYIVDLPSVSFQVNNCNAVFAGNSRIESHTSPLTFAAKTFLANPSEMLFATSKEVVPFGYSLTEPSGSVTCIIVLYKIFTSAKITHIMGNRIHRALKCANELF